MSARKTEEQLLCLEHAAEMRAAMTIPFNVPNAICLIGLMRMTVIRSAAVIFVPLYVLSIKQVVSSIKSFYR
jgi:hypothetical protein